MTKLNSLLILLLLLPLTAQRSSNRSFLMPVRLWV